MDPHWNDEAVSRLPLEGGRAELLEEIMNTDVDHDRPTVTALTTRHRRWLVPAAAAAAVAVLAVGVVQLTADDDAATPPSPLAPALDPEPSSSGHLGLVDAPGWSLDDVDGSLVDGEGEVEFVAGRKNLELSWGPEASYADELDTGQSVDPASPDGAPVEVAAGPARLWSYSDDDHLVLRDVVDGYWLAVRGQGMDAAAFEALLADVRLVDTATFEAALPEEYVTTDERGAVITTMLDDIEAVSGAGLPDGVSVSSTESTRYSIGADIAGGYACAWLEEVVDARRSGDAETLSVATQVIGTARDWPVLVEIAADGGFADTLWTIADESVDGTPPAEWRQGIGC